MLRSRAHLSEASSTAEAPSVSGELLPAVSVPAGDGSNPLRSEASFSIEVSPRTYWSRFKSINSQTRSWEKTESQAATAFLWLAHARPHFSFCTHCPSLTTY